MNVSLLNFFFLFLVLMFRVACRVFTAVIKVPFPDPSFVAFMNGVLQNYASIWQS